MPPHVIICRSNPVAPDPRVEKIARALVKNGWNVEVLGWGFRPELPDEEMREGYRIRRIRLGRPERRGLGNLSGLAAWQAALFAGLVRRRRQYDVLHACDFDTLLPVLVAAKIFGKRVVYDIFDFYADMLRATPGWLVKLARRFELWAIGQADAVILADDSRRSQIAGSSPRRIEIIYNSPEETAPLAPRPVRPAAGQLRIAYAGNLQRERGLFELLCVLEKHPAWGLDLAGFGPDLQEIVDRARRNPRVTWHGLVPYERALELNAAADALLATYDPAVPNNRFSSPNKVFEAMLLGKPVVVARGTNADRLVEEAGCGLVVPYGSETRLEQALESLANDPDLRDRLGQSGRKAYEMKYGWKRMEQRLAGLYGDLTRR